MRVTVLRVDCTTSSEDVQYKTKLSGETLYLMKCSNNGFVSPLNDVPLNTGQRDVFRAVIVTPKLSTEEKTIKTDRLMNPLVFVNKSVGLLWHYGALTQTFEDKRVIDPTTHKKGDNGQLDVFVFGEHAYDYGAVVNVKIVGAYPLINKKSHCTNWQIIAVDANDPRAGTIDNVQNFEREFPKFLIEIEKWASTFDVNAGEPINEILQVVDSPAAVQVVNDKHNLWRAWQETEKYVIGVSPYNTTLSNKWTLNSFNVT